MSRAVARASGHRRQGNYLNVIAGHGRRPRKPRAEIAEIAENPRRRMISAFSALSAAPPTAGSRRGRAMGSRMPGSALGLYRLFFGGSPPGSISIEKGYWPTRSIIRSTLCACQRLPLGVAMPRAANSAAIRRADMPAVCSSDRTGASCRARSIASARLSGASRSAPLRPRRMPRAFADCKAALVLWAIVSLSCSATAARIWRVRRTRHARSV
jgi:hypothetical protein